MGYQFEVREVPAMSVLYVKDSCPQDEIGPTLGRMLPKVYSSLVELGVRPIGPPFCRYTAWHDQDCDLEGGIQVDGLVAGVGEIHGGQLGGCMAVHTIHHGPYTDLKSAHEAIQQWMKENGREPNGAPFELYLTDPGKVADSSQWETEIFWPVAS